MNVVRAGGVLIVLWVGASLHAQEPVAPAPPPADDPAAVFRYDPFQRQLVAVPAAEIKPGYIYNRYSTQLRRRVWSVADASGALLYAMAPGSVQFAWQLDLRATPEQQLRELIARAPELAQIMDIRGARAFMQLDENEVWQLVPRITIASVYDLETLRRYEWHGRRRITIVSSTGYEWLKVDGRFVPAIDWRTTWGAPTTAACW